MERWVTKTICGVAMWVAMMICFLLPIKLTTFFRRRGDYGQRYLDLLACFAGGVFLSAYLIFMAPAVRELLIVNLMVPNNIDYPLPDLFIGLGFFVLLIINRVVISFSKINRKNHSKISNQQLYANHNGLPLNGEQKSCEQKQLNGYESYNSTSNGCEKVTEGKPKREATQLKCCRHSDEETAVDVDDAFQPDCTNPYPLPRRSSIADVVHQDSMLRSMIMMLALSLDSILEGVTTGLKTTNVEIWAIFIGNMVHETVIAFCLGLQLVRVHNSVKPVVIAAIMYSIMNPLGLTIATLIVESMETNSTIDLINGLIQALASGCFLYVTFCEILEGQMTKKISYSKITCMFAGFSVLAIFAAVPGSSAYTLELLKSSCSNQSSTEGSSSGI